MTTPSDATDVAPQAQPQNMTMAPTTTVAVAVLLLGLYWRQTYGPFGIFIAAIGLITLVAAIIVMVGRRRAVRDRTPSLFFATLTQLFGPHLGPFFVGASLELGFGLFEYTEGGAARIAFVVVGGILLIGLFIVSFGLAVPESEEDA